MAEQVDIATKLERTPALNHFTAEAQRRGASRRGHVGEDFGGDSSEKAFSLFSHYRVCISEPCYQIRDNGARRLACLPTVTAHDLKSTQTLQPIRMVKMPCNLHADNGWLNSRFRQCVGSFKGHFRVRVIETFDQDWICVGAELAERIIEIANCIIACHGVRVLDNFYERWQCGRTYGDERVGRHTWCFTAARRTRKLGEFRNGRTGDRSKHGKARRSAVGTDCARITPDFQAESFEDLGKDALGLRRRRFVANPIQQEGQCICSNRTNRLNLWPVDFLKFRPRESACATMVAFNPLRELLALVARLIVWRKCHDQRNHCGANQNRDGKFFACQPHAGMMEVLRV